MAELARDATMGDIDETPWFCHHTLQWLWTMTTETVSLCLMHPNRSKEAFFDLIEDGQGILVSDGYGVYHNGVTPRQTCGAHLLRTARGLSDKSHPELVACGTWALTALLCLVKRANAPPRGQWQAWYVRFCRVFLNIVVGVISTLLAGFLLTPLFGVGTINQDNFSLPALFVSLLGVIILLAIVNLFRRGTVR